jgi:biotin carboxyl carrier protein
LAPAAGRFALFSTHAIDLHFGERKQRLKRKNEQIIYAVHKGTFQGPRRTFSRVRKASKSPINSNKQSTNAPRNEIGVIQWQSRRGVAACDEAVLSPMPGHILAVAVADGDVVGKGNALLKMEVIKM